MLRHAVLLFLIFFSKNVLAIDVLQLRSQVDSNPRAVALKYESQLDHYRKTNQEDMLLSGLVIIAMAYNQIGDTSKIIPVLEEGIVLANNLSDNDALSELLAIRGECETAEGNFAEAVQTFKKAIEISSVKASANTHSLIQTQYGWSLIGTMMRPLDGMPMLKQAQQHFMKMNQPARDAEIRTMFATLHQRGRDYKNAERELHRALELLNPKEHGYLIATISDELANLLIRQKLYTVAKPKMEQALHYYQELQDEMGVAFSKAALVTIAIKTKQWTEARRYALEARPVLLKGGNILSYDALVLDQALAEANLGSNHALVLLDSVQKSHLTDSSVDDKIAYFETAAKVYHALGFYKKASESWLNTVLLLRDDTTKKEQKYLAELSVRYELQQRDNENKRLLVEKDLKSAQLEAQKFRQWSLVGAILLVSIAFIGATFMYRKQKRLRYEYEELAMRDELTGAPNRRAIMTSVEKIISEHPPNMWIAILDLDHFKQINDHYGHDVGDQVLKAFFKSARQSLHSNDKLGRSGGEEWILLFSSPDDESVFRCFERLQFAMKSIYCEGLPESRPVTFSMGATKIRASDDHLSLVLKRADAALYSAKNAGRDQLALG